VSHLLAFGLKLKYETTKYMYDVQNHHHCLDIIIYFQNEADHARRRLEGDSYQLLLLDPPEQVAI
jgi:hypothetical protein